MAPPWPTGAQAQSPEVRARLAAWQAEFEGVRDSALLRRQERAASGDTIPATLWHVRRGLMRIRLGQLGDGWSFRRASGDFDDVLGAEPGWPWAWYAKGIAKLGNAGWLAGDPANLGTRVGMGSVEEAIHCLARALALDPGFTPAAWQLHRAAETIRDTTLLAEIVLPALRSATDQMDTVLAFARGLAERRMGDPAASVAAFERYLAGGGDLGLGLLERARSRMAAGDAAGALDYFTGASVDDSASLATYRADLSLIATDSELVGFEETKGTARAEWLRRFWRDRDRADLREDGERLREHTRRVIYAERHYPLLANRRPYDFTDMVKTGSNRFDDRGVVYVRFGEPDERVTTVTYGMGPNESWHYRRADGDLLLHFGSRGGGPGGISDYIEGGDVQDYRLVPSVFRLPIQGATAMEFAVEDRCPMYPPYCKILHWGRYGREKLRAEERALVEASTFIAVHSDGYELHFPQTFVASANALSLGTSGQRSLAHVVYAVPVIRPDSAPTGAWLRLRVRARVNVFDLAGHSAGYADTTTVVSIPPGPSGRFDMVGRVSLPLQPGRYRYRVALQAGDSLGRVLPTDSMTVRSFTGTELTLSDLALGIRGRSALWTSAPGDTAFLAPAVSFKPEEPVELYYEVYGLMPGARYESRLTIRRGRSRINTTAGSGQAGSAVVRNTRTIDMRTLKPGRYLLELEVRSNGRSAVSRRAFEVKKSEP